MKLLPSEQARRTKQSLLEYQQKGSLVLSDCNCDRPQAGNFGRDYTHTIITLRHDTGTDYVDRGTCDSNHRKDFIECEPKKEIELFFAS